MRKLIWKEWHEQSWKLAFGCIVLGALALIGLQSRVIADESILMWVCLLGFTLLPVLASTGLIAAERAEGSFESLLAMPIAPWRILAAKTVVGLAMCVGPMLVAAAISFFVAGDREIERSTILGLYGRSVLVSVSLFVWMLALTARLPSEARAGLVAVGICICWMLVTAGLARPTVPPILLALSPFAYIRTWSVTNPLEVPNREQIDPQAAGFFAAALLTQALIVAVLWAFAARFFNSSSNRAA